MRLTMHENTVLNAIASCHPVKSSHTKLVKATGMARNELTEVLTDLSKVGFVSVTDKHEVYLIEDGKVHLGLTERATSESLVQNPTRLASTTDRSSVAVSHDAKQPVSLSKTISSPTSNSETTQQEKQAIAIGDVEINETDVLSSIAELGERLARPAINIKNVSLKSEALTKLAELMSDDIAELLLDIKEDLAQVSA